MTKNEKTELLQIAKDRFSEAMAAESDLRKLALEDIRFDNGDQWDDAAKQERIGRPCITINRVAGTNKKIIGDARQNRPRIKARPVDSEGDVKTADLLTGLIRNIENVSDAESAYDNGFECAVRGGIGYWRVLTDYADDAAFEQDILIKRIVNPFAVYYDQSAVEYDYSDARYCFVTETITKEQFKRRYPTAEPVEFETGGEGEAEANWFSEDTARVAEYWYKEKTTKHLFELTDGRTVAVKNPQVLQQPARPEIPPQQAMDPTTGQVVEIPGQPAQPAVDFVYEDGWPQPMPFRRRRDVQCDRVMWCVLAGNQILEGPQEWAGKFIPVVPCLGEEVWIDGKRILRSATRFAKDPQKLYNWARSNTVETLALSPKQPYLVTEDEIEGHESQWQEMHRRPMPYLKYNDRGLGRPARQAASIQDTGAINEAMQAADDIKAATGIYDASLGAKGNETSGRAIIARQREGDTATFVFADNQVRALKYTGKILVDLIPKIYDTQRVVRLLGDDGRESWDTINVLDPASGRVVANDLTTGRYDVTIDAGPGYQTKRLEAAEGILQLIQALPPLAQVLAPRLAKNLDWPEATEIADEIKQLSQPPPAPPDPRVQLDMEKGKLDLQSKQLDNQGKVIDLQSKAQNAAMQGPENDERVQMVVIDTLRKIGILN